MKKSFLKIYTKLLTIVALIVVICLSGGSATHAAGESELPLFNTLGGYGVNNILVSPDGSQLFSYGMPYAELTNIGSGIGKRLEELTNERITDAAYSPDGKLLAVSTNDRYGVIHVYSAHSGKLVDTFRLPNDEQTVTGVSFTNDSSALIAAARGVITVIDISSKKDIIKFDVSEFTSLLEHHPHTNDFAAVILSYDSDRNLTTSLQIRSDKTGQIVKTVYDVFPETINNSSFMDIAYSPDGKYLAVSYTDGSDKNTVVLDVNNNYATLAELKSAGNISFSKNDRLMIVGSTVYPISEKFTSFFKVKNKTDKKELNSSLTALTPDDKYFIYVADETIKVLDASSLMVWLVSLSIEPSDISLFVKDIEALELRGTYSDGTKKTIDSSKANWGIEDFHIADIDKGILNVTSSGKTTLTAEYAGLEASAQLTTAEAPVPLKATLEGEKVKLEWETVKNVTDLLGYKVYRTTLTDAGDVVSTTSLTDFAMSETTYVDNTITSDYVYYYFIKAVYKGNNEIPATEKVYIHSGQKEIILQVDNPYMEINGTRKEIDAGRGTAPLLYNGRTVLPIRSLITELGGTLELVKESKIIIKLNGITIELWINENKAIVNGKETMLDVPPVVIKGRTMVPLRFVSENLKLQLDWESSTQTITINETPAVG